MAKLMRAFFFKLKRDLTFRITLFVGIGLSIFLTFLYKMIDLTVDTALMCTGQNMLVTSLSPAQNFGIAIPVNLISFTVLEFTQGTIRNKIIAGNSKTKIYLSLFLNGLIFSIILLVLYVGMCTALGSIFGGFDANGRAGSALMQCTPKYLIRLIILTLVCYISITAFAVFVAVLVRQIGGCIPIVIIIILACSLSSSFIPLATQGNETVTNILSIVNPLYGVCALALGPLESGEGVIAMTMTDLAFYGGISSNLFYAFIFNFFGILIFKKRDVK